MDVETLALHGGYLSDAATGSTATPIHQTTAYAYDTAEGLSDAFTGRGPGYVYSRIANPTSAAFERRLAEMEGGVGCLSCSSGMAAIASVTMGLTRAGDHIVAAKGIFGGTVSFLAKTLSRFGVRTTFVDAADAEAFRAAIEPETKLVFVETITNPRMDVPDLPAVARITHEAGIPLVVDSTVTTPVLLRPGEWGADIVVHSVSKFINGHGNSIGGAVVDTGRFGGVLAFGLGSAEAAFELVDHFSLAQNLANIGDSKTLVIHPASTIFSEFAPEERLDMGVPDDLVRVSVGIEAADDIIADFESALEKV